MGLRPTRKSGAYTPAEKMRRYRRRLKRENPSAKTVAKQRRRAERERALTAATIQAWDQLGDKLFPVLYVDFAWRIEPWSRETGLNRAADNHYPTMTLAEVKAAMAKLPAAENCVLFLWEVAELHDELKGILVAGGFKYRSRCMWLKEGKQPGLGHWFRFKHEMLIVAVRGEIPAPAQGENLPAEFLAPDPAGALTVAAPWEGHSHKPEVFAEMIAAYYPTCPKLEMFYRSLDDPEAERLRRAKREAAGWYFHGNEAEGAGREVLAAIEAV